LLTALKYALQVVWTLTDQICLVLSDAANIHLRRAGVLASPASDSELERAPGDDPGNPQISLERAMSASAS
jgi:hypothetical protein